MSVPAKDADGLRRYGRYQHKEDLTKCVESVWRNDGARFGTSHQCERKRGFGPNGEFCKQHSPEAKEARAAASSDRWAAKSRAFTYEMVNQRVGEWIRANRPDLFKRIADGTEQP